MSSINKVKVHNGADTTVVVDISKPQSAENLGGNTAEPEDVLEGKYFYHNTGALTPGQLKLGENKTITKNGSYVASDDGVAAYKKIEVDVPIPNGYLKPEGTYAISENGTYTISKYEKVAVSVEGGGEGESGGFNTSDATATADDLRVGKTAYVAEGLTSGTIEDFDGTDEDIENGEKIDGFVRTIAEDQESSSGPFADTLYNYRAGLAFKDVIMGMSLEEIQQKEGLSGFILKMMSGGKKGSMFPIRATADLPENPLFSSDSTYYLYLYDRNIVEREATTTAYYWNAGVPWYTFSSETDTKETITKRLRGGGYLLATLNDVGPVYRVYPSFTIDGVIQVWVDIDEGFSEETSIIDTSATFYYFYPYSYEECGSTRNYFMEACAERELPEGVYFAVSQDYWQPCSSLMATSSSSSLIDKTYGGIYGGIIYENADGSFSYEGVKEDFGEYTKNGTPPADTPYYALLAPNSYYLKTQVDEDDGEVGLVSYPFGMDGCLPPGSLDSVVIQNGVFPNYNFYYKDSQTIFSHQVVQTATFLPKKTLSSQFYCKANKPNSLYRGTLMGLSQPYDTVGLHKKSFSYSFTKEESPLEWYVLDENEEWQEAKVVEISRSVDSYYGDRTGIVAETDNYRTSYARESAYAGNGYSLTCEKKNAETGDWEEFKDIYNDTTGEGFPSPPTINVVVVGNVPENMRDWFVGYFEPQSYDEYVLSTATGLPIEIATEAEMEKQLETAEFGSVFKYTGTTTTKYENGELYIVEAD